MTTSDTPGAVTQGQVYEQRCAEFRSLNGFFWQIPLIVMPLNGGLWFAVASLELTSIARGMILLFAACTNAAMIIILWRLRNLMETLLGQIRTAEGISDPNSNRIVLWVFSVMLALAGLGAAGAAIFQDQVFKAKAPKPAEGYLLVVRTDVPGRIGLLRPHSQRDIMPAIPGHLHRPPSVIAD